MRQGAAVKGFVSSMENNVIVITYIFVVFIKLIYSLIYYNENVYVIAARVISLLIYMSLAYFSCKGNLISSIVMAIIIFITGVGNLILSTVVGGQQLILKITTIIIGVFFIYGAIKIFVRVKEMRIKTS